MYSLILHGRRSIIELQKCRHLINPFQNISAFSNFFSTASFAYVKSQDGLKGKTFTVSYLIASLGLARKLAESISRKVSLEDTCNADSVLSLLRSYGFKDSQISNIISSYPQLLVLDAEKSIGPKLEFLLSREGASSSELTEVLSKVPKLFGKKGDKTISRYYDFVKEVIEADKSPGFGKLCWQQGSMQENKFRNLSVLRELGVPQRLLFPLLISDCSVCCGKERFEETLKKVVEMGFDPRTPKFVQALQGVYQMSDKTVEERVMLYNKLGFDVEEVWEIFRKWPCFMHYSEMKIENSMQTFLSLGFSRDEFVMIVKRVSTCIGLSTETVRKKTEFVVKQMNWPLKALVSYPQVFGYSMEKRILPRCNVIKALMSKRLLGPELPSLWSVLVCTNEVFLKRFVRKHDDKELVAELMAIFREKDK